MSCEAATHWTGDGKESAEERIQEDQLSGRSNPRTRQDAVLIRWRGKDFLACCRIDIVRYLYLRVGSNIDKEGGKNEEMEEQEEIKEESKLIADSDFKQEEVNFIFMIQYLISMT